MCAGDALADPGPAFSWCTPSTNTMSAKASSHGMLNIFDQYDTYMFLGSRSTWNLCTLSNYILVLTRFITFFLDCANVDCGSSGSWTNHMPKQPFVADPNMPPPPFPNTDNQLIEAGRRLNDQMPKKNHKQRYNFSSSYIELTYFNNI